jgi:hypothetical protein
VTNEHVSCSATTRDRVIDHGPGEMSLLSKLRRVSFSSYLVEVEFGCGIINVHHFQSKHFRCSFIDDLRPSSIVCGSSHLSQLSTVTTAGPHLRTGHPMREC